MKNMPPFRPAIIVMVKAPRPGTVKTRLAPFLSFAESAALAACFLHDTVAAAQFAASHVIIAFAPTDGRAELTAILPPNLIWHEQAGGDLGARLAAAIDFALAENFAPVIVIGTDSPTLPTAYLQTAVAWLAAADNDVTLGESADGGFYLLGLRQNHQNLFTEIEWSTSAAGAQMIANIERLQLKMFRLPVWYDVDTAEDLAVLRAEMQKSGAAMRERAPRTFAWLQARFGN